MNHEIPTIGSLEVYQKSKELKEHLSAELSEDRSFKHVPAQKVFESLGLKRIHISDLPDGVKKKIVDAVRGNKSAFHYAIPTGIEKRLSGERDWPEHIHLAGNDDFSTLYFYIDSPNRTPYGHVSWSQLRDWGDGYEITPMNHDNYTGELVNLLSLYEAQVDVANKTRGDISEITG